MLASFKSESSDFPQSLLQKLLLFLWELLSCFRGRLEVISRRGAEATLQGCEIPVSSMPDPLSCWQSSRVNLVETAVAVSSTAAGSYCHLSHSPKGKPTAGSGPTQYGGSGSSINKVVFLGAAAEEMQLGSGVLNKHSLCPPRS